MSVQGGLVTIPLDLIAWRTLQQRKATRPGPSNRWRKRLRLERRSGQRFVELFAQGPPRFKVSVTFIASCAPGIARRDSTAELTGLRVLG